MTRWDGIAMLLETPKKDDLADDMRNLEASLRTGRGPGLHPARPA